MISASFSRKSRGSWGATKFLPCISTSLGVRGVLETSHQTFYQLLSGGCKRLTKRVTLGPAWHSSGSRLECYYRRLAIAAFGLAGDTAADAMKVKKMLKMMPK